LVANVIVDGPTEIGDDTIVYAFAVIGSKGQDLKYQGDDDITGVKIGKRNRIREYATIQQGTPASHGTVVGDDCQIMINAHVAHDVQMGNDIILSNLVQLAGHVEVEDHAIISGASVVHQFCRIGKYAFIGGMTGVTVDIVPYCIAAGAPAKYQTINRVGLTRHGLTPEDIHAIHDVYSVAFAHNSDEPLEKRLKDVRKKIGSNPYALDALDFIENRSTRGINVNSKR
jgi:UDP-N-acetylglucosamine acyltransferase